MSRLCGVAQKPHALFSNGLSKHTNNARIVICMAHPRRVVKVAKQIEREIGNLFMYDRVMQEAICPERRRGLDGAVSALASVTEVELTNDLQVAKVFLSIYSDELGKETAIKGLKNLEGYARKHIGKTVRLRLTPEIRFVMDESIERSERVLKLLEQVKQIQSGEQEPPPIAIADNDYDSEDEDYENDDDDDIETMGQVGGPGGIVVADLGFFESAPSRKPNRSSNKKKTGSLQGSKQSRDDNEDNEEELSASDIEMFKQMFKREKPPSQ